jgi:SH3-like domain-containing protein
MKAYRFLAVLALCAVTLASILYSPLRAQDKEVPYWAALRFERVNMRVGPSAEYPIDWVYQRKNLPVKVIRLREGWRLVEDPDGAQGWISRSQLTDDRSALVIGKGPADMRASGSASSALRWRAQPGVVGKLLRCRENWCEINVEGRTGWVLAERLWGAGEP